MRGHRASHCKEIGGSVLFSSLLSGLAGDVCENNSEYKSNGNGL
jgi:hypothetical protein